MFGPALFEFEIRPDLRYIRTDVVLNIRPDVAFNIRSDVAPNIRPDVDHNIRPDISSLLNPPIVEPSLVCDSACSAMYA